MSKSPKALLPSTLPLSSLSRALSTAPSSSAKYAARASPALPHPPPRADARGQGGARRSFVVVRQRRPPSPLSGPSPTAAAANAARPSGSTAPSGARHASTAAQSGDAAARASSSGLLRSASVGTASSSSTGTRTLAGYFDARQFHSAPRAAHQHAVAPSSSGLGDLPPGGASASAEGPAFQPKHHSSLTTPTAGDGSGGGGGGAGGPLLLAPAHAQGSHGGASLALDPAASSPAASTSQASQHASSSGAPTAAGLFSHAQPAQVPPHALPSFFGSALSIARRSNLVFRNGAYGIPKPERYRVPSAKGKEKALGPGEGEPEHYLSVGVGEDSYFLRSDSLGVADGVGGWSGHAGANSARWARKFMHHCSSELARYENVDDDMFLQYYEVDPVDVMQRAYEKTLSECKEEGTIGSSTALLAVLRNDELRLANLGDCSCCVIRGDEYIFRTEEQQHRFNYPFQAGTNAKDVPVRDAQKFAVKVQRDDIVILASDGLVDNVFSDDLLEEVLRFVGSHPTPPPSSTSSAASGKPGAPRYTLRRFSPQAVSEALCFRAKSVYEDQRAVASPFQQRAMEEGIHYAGGKPDDISCLVGVVGELEASPNRRDVQ
ncbi:hypothetical protein JCM10449v2_000403 [Rhodotorula kratochvilovae]